MSRASALVLPSWWEGSSNVLLEALACGTPVVASRSAGDAETVLEEGRFGALVDPGDPLALAEAMIAQVGPDAVLPGGRAAAFDRARSLGAYTSLLRRVAAQGAAEPLVIGAHLRREGERHDRANRLPRRRAMPRNLPG